jgi:hypothetical protein
MQISLLAACVLLVVRLVKSSKPENGNSTFFRNVDEPDYMESLSNKWYFLILIDVKVSNSRQFALISR